MIFTLGLVALLVLLEVKSLCIPEHCRFLLGLLIPVLGIAVFGKIAGASAALGTAYNLRISAVTLASAFAVNSRMILVNSILPLAGFFISLQAFNCTSCLSYLPSSIAYIAVVYVASQFELPDTINLFLSPINLLEIYFPLLNFITSVYIYFDFKHSFASTISAYATFITQTGLVYILFLAPALIAGFLFSCSRPVSAAVLGAAIAATAISFGAFGIANVISGVLLGIARINGVIVQPITNFITFAQFLRESSLNSFCLLWEC